MEETKTNGMNNLSDENLDAITGGYIVRLDDGTSTPWAVVDDKTGNLVYYCTDLVAAKNTADWYGCWQELLTKEQYKKKFGREWVDV